MKAENRKMDQLSEEPREKDSLLPGGKILLEFFEALKRPYTNFGRLMIGLLVSLIPILHFATFGYALRAGTGKDKELPTWNKFGELWVHGLLAFIILMIWSIPLLIFVFEGIGLLPQFYPSSVTLTLMILLFLLEIYLVPIALLNFETKGFSEAFAFGQIINKALTGKWLSACFRALIAAILINIVGMFLDTLLEVTVVLPFIVKSWVFFVEPVTFFTLCGKGYR